MSKLSVIGILIIIAGVCIFCSRRCTKAILSGNVTKESRPVSSFTKLSLDGVFKTVISQDGGPAWVRVEADKDLQKTIEVKNSGETLEIRSKNNLNGFSGTYKTTVYVNVKDINSLSNSAVGAVVSEGLIKSSDLYIKNSAVGSTTLHIDVQNLTADIEAVGATTLTGHAALASLTNKSVGKLNADELKVNDLTIRNDAVGAVEVYAEKEISIVHDGVGRLRYHGPAAVRSLRDNGVGKVIKAD